jgi:hypothetical protein
VHFAHNQPNQTLQKHINRSHRSLIENRSHRSLIETYLRRSARIPAIARIALMTNAKNLPSGRRPMIILVSDVWSPIERQNRLVSAASEDDTSIFAWEPPHNVEKSSAPARRTYEEQDVYRFRSITARCSLVQRRLG